jgi:hypothetical protein
MGQRHSLELQNKFGSTFHFLIGVDDIVLDVVFGLLRASTNCLDLVILYGFEIEVDFHAGILQQAGSYGIRPVSSSFVDIFHTEVEVLMHRFLVKSPSKT